MFCCNFPGGCRFPQQAKCTFLAGGVGLFGEHKGKVELGRDVVQFSSKLKKVLGLRLILRNSQPPKVQDPQIAGSRAAAFLCRFAKELNGEDRILTDAETPHVRDAKVHLCANESAGHCALEPLGCASGIAFNPDTCLVEVADFLLRGRISRVRAFWYQ